MEVQRQIIQESADYGDLIWHYTKQIKQT